MAGRDVIGRSLVASVENAGSLVRVLVTAGVAGLLLLPLAERANFFDENALLVGSTVQNVGSFARSQHPGNSLPDRLAKSLQSGQDVRTVLQREVSAPISQHAFSTRKHENCTNLHAITYSPRGDGTESIALVTPVLQACLAHRGKHSTALDTCTHQARAAGVSALTIGVLLSNYLSTVPWLAKDFLWVVPDARCGAVTATTAWLSRYQDEAQADASSGTSDDFFRAGSLQQAVVLDLKNGNWQDVRVSGISDNGLLPKLDLFMLAHHFFGPARRKPVHLADTCTLAALLPSPLAWMFDQIQATGGSEARAYVRKLEGLLCFVVQQAAATPTGAHAPFKPFLVDAVSVSAGRVAEPPKLVMATLVEAAVALEGVLRSCNNLLERLHHSYFMYLQPSTTSFITIEAYIVLPALLLLAAFLWAAKLLVVLPPAPPPTQPALCTPASGLQRLQTWVKAWRRRGRGGDEEAQEGGPVCYPASVMPVRLAGGVHALLSAGCRVLLVQLLCAAVGMAIWVTGLSGANLMESLANEAGKVVPTVVAASFGVCGLFHACLLGATPPAASQTISASKTGKTSTSEPEVLAQSGSEGLPAESVSPPAIPRWQLDQAAGLLFVVVLGCAWLFVNWASVYLALICLVPHLLMCRPLKLHSRVACVSSLLQLGALAVLHPWMLVSFQAVAPEASVTTGRSPEPVEGSMALYVLGSQMSLVLFWAVYLPLCLVCMRVAFADGVPL